MFIKIYFLFFIFQYLVFNILASRSYEKWNLLEVRPASRNSSSWKQILSQLETWKHLRVIDAKDVIKIGIGPEFQFQKLEKLSRKFKLKTKLLHDDISKLIADVHRTAKRSLSEDHFDRYMDYEKMENYFSDLQSSYPETVKRKILGKSYEGRNISLFIISSNKNPGISKQTELPDATNHFNFKRTNRNLNSNAQVRRSRQNQRNIQLGNSTHNFIYFNIDILKSLNQSTAKVKKEDKLANEKPIIFIDAGLHSREWICPAVALYLIKHLAESPSLISRIDWFIVPLANPDGYKFSWNGDRFWRKTRSLSETGCYGADMNRNFDFHWGEVDTSTNSCSEHYGGKGPNSEIETVLISDALRKQKHRLKAYISLHNWGQQILYPYSYSEEKSPQSEAEMNRVGEGMVHAIKKAQNADYQTGRGSLLLYPASGTSIDWAYDVLGVPYSYLIELRDSLGTLGFLLPENLIKPTGADMFAAIEFLANEILINRNESWV